METTTAGQDARGVSRIFLRPIGSLLPLGMAALAGASIMLTGDQLGWLSVAQGHDVAAAILAFAVPLQYLASVFRSLGRDSAGDRHPLDRDRCADPAVSAGPTQPGPGVAAAVRQRGPALRWGSGRTAGSCG